jgi:hypothetical protein
MRGGITARIAGAGLGGCSLADGTDQVSASLVSLACCAAVFLGLDAAIWSQLTIGWQWSAPDARATTVAMVMLSAAMLAFTVLAAVAAVPVMWCVAARISRRLAGPVLLTAAGAAVMFVGARHFGNGWPGTGGHVWARPGLVPGGVAAFRLGVAACATMVVFLSGCCAWLVDGGPGPRNLFHASAIDIVAAAVMAVAFAVAQQAVRQAQRSGVASVTR